MTTGTLKTQGTRLFFAYQESEILRVLCPTGVSGLGGQRSQIDISCLDSIEDEFVGGRKAPGQITVPVNFIPNSAAHQALIALDASGDKVSWMVVGSDQAGAPNSLDSEFRLVSPGATSCEFIAHIADMTIDFANNEIVRAQLTLQRSGPNNWTFPAAVQ